MRKYSNHVEDLLPLPLPKPIHSHHNSTRNKTMEPVTSENDDKDAKNKKPPRINNLKFPSITINKIENIDCNIPKEKISVFEINTCKSACAIIDPKTKIAENKSRLNHFLRKIENIVSSSSSNNPRVHKRDGSAKPKTLKVTQTPTAVGPLYRVDWNIRGHMESAPVLILHLDGVLYSRVYSCNNFLMLGNKRHSCHYLRSHFAVGLKTLSKHFLLILYSTGVKKRRLCAITEFIKAHGVQFDAVYHNSENDGPHDYSQIFKDLQIDTSISTRVLCIEACKSTKQIDTMVHSSHCASDSDQLNKYSNVPTLYIPHMMFSENVHRALSLSSLASIILFFALVNKASIKKINSHQGNTIKILCENIIKLEYIDRPFKADSLSFGNYKIEPDEFHFMRKTESDESDIFMSVENVNWRETFEILAATKSNLYQLMENPCKRIIANKEKEDQLNIRWNHILGQRHSAEPSSPRYDTSTLLTKINPPLSIRGKVQMLVCSNIDMMNYIAAHKYSNIAVEEAQYSPVKKDMSKWHEVRGFIDEACKLSAPLIMLNSWKLHKDNVEISDKFKSYAKETKY